MKNHIIFKFIAVVLCTVSLMGAVGGVLGVALLTSGGLYDVTVEEMVSAQVSQDSADLAQWLAKNYASTELGGAGEALVSTRYGSHWFANQYDPAHYGYTVTDAEGNELMSFNPELRDREDLYARESFTATGKYIHVVSLESQEEMDARQQALRESLLGSDVVLEGSGNTVPAEGAMVESVLFVDAQGQPVLEAWDNGAAVIVTEYTQGYTNNWTIGEQSLGFLFYSPLGNLLFHSGFDYRATVGSFRNTDVCEAYFTFRDGQVRLRENGTVGQLYLNDSGHLMFLSAQTLLTEAAEEETVPETAEATVPETTVETLPLETAPAVTEATWPAEETWTSDETWPAEETVASLASDIPEEIPPETAAAEEVPPYTEEILYTEPVAVETLPAETLPPETVPAETVPAETLPAETVAEPVLIDGKPLGEYQILSEHYYDSQLGQTMEAKFVYVPMPELTVEVYMTEGALRYGNGYTALEILRQFRSWLLPAVGICLLVFAVFGVYLCTAAGRKPKCEEVRAGGLNRLPLDLYLLGGGFAAACVIAVGGELMMQVLEQDLLTGCGLLAAVCFFSSLMAVGFLFAFVAQLKTPGGFWWRNTFCGHCVRLMVKLALWLKDVMIQKGLPLCGRVMGAFWRYTIVSFVWLYRHLEKVVLWSGDKLGRLGRWLWKMLNRFLKLLPVTWQWMVAGMVMIFCSALAFRTYNAFLTLLCLLIPIAILLYGAYCYGALAESTRRMGKGDLDTKVDDRLLVGCFRDSAADLNALADVAVVAAQNQLKSERMKTELITNVSHDIKTPLTSIINYVDLLRKPHTEEEGEQFLEVLDRQSQRLKKLIDDLMDMSKADTGNMQVEITTLDAVEAVNQALGEFADKLDRAGLVPVFRHAEEPLLMRADGRLVWRVLSNLLGNAVKYAMPGTRLYVDLMAMEGKTVISLKNISREELKLNSEELMARFIRADESRNTEGSGLGLNIARSLMELQKGQLQLLVDGDLFKVTLIFPSAEQ